MMSASKSDGLQPRAWHHLTACVIVSKYDRVVGASRLAQLYDVTAIKIQLLRSHDAAQLRHLVERGVMIPEAQRIASGYECLLSHLGALPYDTTVVSLGDRALAAIFYAYNRLLHLPPASVPIGGPKIGTSRSSSVRSRLRPRVPSTPTKCGQMLAEDRVTPIKDQQRSSCN
jgi:hypothetical protein